MALNTWSRGGYHQLDNGYMGTVIAYEYSIVSHTVMSTMEAAFRARGPVSGLCSSPSCSSALAAFRLDLSRTRRPSCCARHQRCSAEARNHPLGKTRKQSPLCLYSGDTQSTHIHHHWLYSLCCTVIQQAGRRNSSGEPRHVQSRRQGPTHSCGSVLWQQDCWSRQAACCLPC